MIVFGVNDTHLGLNAVGNLRNLANNEITVIQKAGHACMHEQPKVWNEHLYNFLHATKFKRWTGIDCDIFTLAPQLPSNL